MSTYSAKAHREGKWWVIDVDGVGVTQARNLAEADSMAVDLVASMQDVDPSSVEVALTVDLPAEVRGQIARAKARRDSAAAEQSAAALDMRTAASELRLSLELPGKDVAYILEVSEQRVSQLLTPTPGFGDRRVGSGA